MKNNNNDFEWTKELIKQCIDDDCQELNKKDKCGDTGFIWACKIHPKLTETMLEKEDINFNLKNDAGWTGFTIVCLMHPKLAEMMLEKTDIDFNIQNNIGETGFILACIEQPKLMKQMLNNKKIDKELKDKDGLTGHELAKRHNQESFEIYQAWLTEKEKNHINTQVQKISKKSSQHL